MGAAEREALQRSVEPELLTLQIPPAGIFTRRASK